MAKWDVPGGPLVKNLSCNSGDTSSIPGQGTKIPHAAGQLRLHATTRQPACRNYRAYAHWSPRATTREKLQLRPQRRACAPELRPDAANK